MDPRQYLILNIKNYFQLAEELVQLEELFKNETLFKKLSFWVDMIIYPISIIVSILYFGQNMGIFTIISIYKAISKWQQYLRYLELKYDINEWKSVIDSVGGPFISTNDDKYHVYVYADGMQRLYNNLLGNLLFSKKSTKCL
jgi:hypothetical protein